MFVAHPQSLKTDLSKGRGQNVFDYFGSRGKSTARCLSSLQSTAMAEQEA